MTAEPWGYDDKLIEWLHGYEKPKAQKAQIKKELLRVRCQPPKWSDWCMPEDDKKKKKEKLWNDK